MDVPNLLYKLLLIADIEIVVAFLPKMIGIIADQPP